MCMIGDRLDTDIEFGKAHGLNTVLVLSGVTAHHQLDLLVKRSALHVPDYVCDSIQSLKDDV